MGMEEAAETQTRTLRFQRRAMLKMMMALPIAGLMPLSSLAEVVARTAPDSFVSADGTAWKLRVLTPHEWTTVGVLSDWILPADEVSGSATDAGVPEFIDDWLDFQRGDLLVEIREGLALARHRMPAQLQAKLCGLQRNAAAADTRQDCVAGKSRRARCEGGRILQPVSRPDAERFLYQRNGNSRLTVRWQ